MSEQVQLNHILIDVDFFDKPKIKALAYKYDQISVLLLIKIYTSMSRATNALVTRDTIEALAWEMRFDAEKVEPFLSYAVLESLLILDGNLYTSGRVKEDQQKLALARKESRERQQRARDSRVTGGEKTRDSVPVTVTDPVIDINNKNSKREKPKRDELKIPDWVATDPRASNAINEWIHYRKDIKKKLTQQTLDAQLKKFSTPSVLAQSIGQSIEKGWTGLFEPDNPSSKNSAIPKSILDTRAKFEAIDNQ